MIFKRQNWFFLNHSQEHKQVTFQTKKTKLKLAQPFWNFNVTDTQMHTFNLYTSLFPLGAKNKIIGDVIV